MATLEDRLEELILALGTDWKTFATYLFGNINGTLNDLPTVDKSSFVAALAEVKDIAEAGGSGGTTNLTRTLSPTTVVINSDTGTDATIPAADAVNAGVMSKAMYDKLTGIESSADVTDAQNIAASVNGASAKSVPVGGDYLAIVDTEAANVLAKLTIANLTTFVLSAAGAGAPELLNTIDEIAQALGDNPDVITNLLTTVGQKADLTAVYTKTEIDNMLGDPDNDLVAAYETAKA